MESDLAQIAQSFKNDVSANLSTFVNRYREQFGKRIDTDSARELCPAYKTNQNNRALLAPLIHETASRIAQAVWHTLLNESWGQPGVVIFLAGGPGSGKSTVVNNSQFQDQFQDAIVLYDSTFANYNSATGKIQKALSADKDIDIYYVHRNAENAADSVVVRAIETGRTVPKEEVANLHWDAQMTILRLCDEYRYTENVMIHLFNNSGKPGSADWFPNEDALRRLKYSSKMEVQALVNRGMKKAYDRIRKNTGNFPANIARGIFGSESPF